MLCLMKTGTLKFKGVILLFHFSKCTKKKLENDPTLPTPSQTTKQTNLGSPTTVQLRGGRKLNRTRHSSWSPSACVVIGSPHPRTGPSLPSASPIHTEPILTRW